MKYCSLLLGAIFACANISAADYLQKKPEEKIAHKDLTFAATFDNYGMKAQLAKGQSDSNLKNVNLLLRGVVGFDDKQGYQPLAEEELIYPAPGNISSAEGTLSFWICQSPLTPGQKPSNIALFKFTAKDASQTTHYEIYEYNNNIVAEEFKTVFIPLQSILNEALKHAPQEYWLRDGVHPLPAGHALISQAWIKATEGIR